MRKISRFSNKKAQAAMEFLMTYGWALLVVLVAIAALVYFGVLSPGRFLPEKCTLITGLSCNDFVVTTNNLDLVVNNGLGTDLKNVAFAITDEETYFCGNNTGTLPDSMTKTLDLECCDWATVESSYGTATLGTVAQTCADDDSGLDTPLGVSGQKFKVDIKMEWETENGIVKKRSGELVAEIQEN